MSVKRRIGGALAAMLMRLPRPGIDSRPPTRGSWRCGSATSRRASCFSGSTGRPALDVVEQLRHVGEAERPHVHAVDRGHRRDVAGAEALERAHVEFGLRVRSFGGRLGDRLVQLVGAAQRAGDVGAHVHAVASHGRGLEHVVEARHRLQVGGGHAHHARDLLDRLRRAPAVHALGGLQCRQRGGAAVGVVGHVRLDLRAQLSRHVGAGCVGDLAGSFSRSAARSQPGTREPCSKRRTGVLIGRFLRGPDRASPGWRSGRRCRRRVHHRRGGLQVDERGVAHVHPRGL